MSDHAFSAAPAPAIGPRGAMLGMLRAEGAAAMVAGVDLFVHAGQPWWLFAVLFLAPDLGFLGYLAGPRVGAATYNALHTYASPVALGLAATAWAAPAVLGVAAIWVAHIGFDRLLGYGLKYASGFNETHLGPIGRARR